MCRIAVSHYPGKPFDLDDSFRLIELQSGDYEDNLRIRLLNCSLSDAPEYECLSYVWGDASKVAQIQVIDGSDKQTAGMGITINCHAALRRLRRSDQSRILWVDAICINQALVRERNHQLSLMARIYQGASRVVVYLGESDNESEAAMDWIRELDQPSDYASGNSYQDRPKILRPDITMIEALFHRPWFHRVWVLQEITLARDAVVVCGHQEVHWDSFRAFRHWNITNRWIKRLPYAVSYPMSRKSNWNNFVPYLNRLLDLLRATRHCGATDPRDKLYAVLPLLDHEHDQMMQFLEEVRSDPDLNPKTVPDKEKLEKTVRIAADYSRSAQQVFVDLAIILLEQFGLDMLRLVIQHSLVPGLPSWVPDWSPVEGRRQQALPASSPGFYAGFKDKPQKYWGSTILQSQFPQSWGVSHVSPSQSNPNTQLRVVGVEIGSIQLIGETCDVANNFFPISQWKRLAADPKYHEEPKAPEGDLFLWLRGPGPLSPFQRTIATDNVFNPEAVTHAIQRIEFYNGEFGDAGDKTTNNFWRGDEEKVEKLPLRDIFNRYGSYGKQAERIFNCCDGRRFFVTDNGYIGLAPEKAAVGDVILVLDGASVPFIFRYRPSLASNIKEKPDSSVDTSAEDHSEDLEFLTLVGESYVQGIMGGEIWNKMDQNNDIRAKEILVC